MSYKPKTEASRRYSELLKDPRWKIRREEILKRDDHTCRKCEAKNPPPFIEHEDGYREEIENPEPVRLEVHHKYYVWGQMPWEYPNSALITLCEMCHDVETAYAKPALERLTHAARSRFLSSDLERLAHAFEFLQMPFKGNERAARIIAWALTNSQVIGFLEDLYDGETQELRPVSDLVPTMQYAGQEWARG